MAQRLEDTYLGRLFKLFQRLKLKDSKLLRPIIQTVSTTLIYLPKLAPDDSLLFTEHIHNQLKIIVEHQKAPVSLDHLRFLCTSNTTRTNLEESSRL